MLGSESANAAGTLGGGHDFPLLLPWSGRKWLTAPGFSHTCRTAGSKSFPGSGGGGLRQRGHGLSTQLLHPRLQ